MVASIPRILSAHNFIVKVRLVARTGRTRNTCPILSGRPLGRWQFGKTQYSK